MKNNSTLVGCNNEDKYWTKSLLTIDSLYILISDDDAYIYSYEWDNNNIQER
jgi:hypothetical protein